MAACGEFTIPGDKMPPNTAEAEVAYAIFIELIESGKLIVYSEKQDDCKTLIRWEIKK